ILEPRIPFQLANALSIANAKFGYGGGTACDAVEVFLIGGQPPLACGVTRLDLGIRVGARSLPNQADHVQLIVVLHCGWITMYDSCHNCSFSYIVETFIE